MLGRVEARLGHFDAELSTVNREIQSLEEDSDQLTAMLRNRIAAADALARWLQSTTVPPDLVQAVRDGDVADAEGYTATLHELRSKMAHMRSFVGHEDLQAFPTLKVRARRCRRGPHYARIVWLQRRRCLRRRWRSPRRGASRPSCWSASAAFGPAAAAPATPPCAGRACSPSASTPPFSAATRPPHTRPSCSATSTTTASTSLLPCAPTRQASRRRRCVRSAACSSLPPSSQAAASTRASAPCSFQVRAAGYVRLRAPRVCSASRAQGALNRSPACRQRHGGARGGL